MSRENRLALTPKGFRQPVYGNLEQCTQPNCGFGYQGSCYRGHRGFAVHPDSDYDHALREYHDMQRQQEIANHPATFTFRAAVTAGPKLHTSRVEDSKAKVQSRLYALMLRAWESQKRDGISCLNPACDVTSRRSTLANPLNRGHWIVCDVCCAAWYCTSTCRKASLPDHSFVCLIVAVSTLSV